MAQFSWRFVVWFCVLLLALVFFTIMSVTMTIRAHAGVGPAASSVIYIDDDHGGNVGEYYRKYEILAVAGAELHFKNGCYSACTFAIFKEFHNLRLCAESGAVFGFHKPFQMTPDKKVVKTKQARKEAMQIWELQLNSYPDVVAKYLRSVRVPSPTDGDEANVMLLLPADLLMPRCPLTVAAQ